MADTMFPKNLAQLRKMVASPMESMGRTFQPSQIWTRNSNNAFISNQLALGLRSPVPFTRPYSGRRKDVKAAAVEISEGGQGGQRIIETELRHEAEQSYLSYAMSVIVGRALPDARDGLKPVHRRILYAMHELGLAPNKPFKKCARVVGEVLGKFHPHGDTAVYDALVRMSQDFSMRAPLIDGHGNFGSLDDDPAAAMRYTECRLQPLAAAALLADLDSDTVDFLPNFDASVMEPAVLPARVPNLLINGSSGIAVGIATKIPPHNMREVVQGLKALMKDPDISAQELVSYIPAPDFPTGGEIIADSSIREAYTNGKGTIVIRAKMHIEDAGKKKAAIVITELPYQTNKAALVEQVAKLVDDGKIGGISDIRDESDRSGTRVVIEIKRGSSPQLTMNQLVKYTTIQTRFSCNMIGLVNGLPKTLTLKDFLNIFLDFRCQVIKRRAEFELAKAKKRLHLVEGFLAAMANLDAIVETIRRARDGEAALQLLQSSFTLTQQQAEGVLSLTLRRLTSMEANSLAEEQSTLCSRIADLQDILQRKDRILQIIAKEADEVAERHGNDRRTAIVTNSNSELREVDVIPNAPSIIVYSRKGYIKRMTADTFAVQGVRGTGKSGTRLRDEDCLEEVVSANDHDNLLFFTTHGHVYALNAYDIPQASRTASGTAITQVLRIAKPSVVAAMLPVSQFADDIDIVMLSANGMIKRTTLSQFSKITSRGVSCMKLEDGDSLKFVNLCSATDSVLLTSSKGMALHFPINLLRPLSRISMGYKTMDVGDGSLVGMSILPKGIAPEGDDREEDMVPDETAADDDAAGSADGPCLLCLTKKGLGKRVPVSLFRVKKNRRGKGLTAIRLSAGDALAAADVVGAARDGKDCTQEDALISTVNGMLLRVPISQVAKTSRYAKGHRVVKVKEGDEVSAVTAIQHQ